MQASQPKILLLIESGGPGGAERLVLNLAEAYKARGLEVAVLNFRDGWLTQELDERKIPRFSITSERSLDLSLPFKIAEIVKREKFSVIHSHLLDSNFYGGLAARIAGVKHVATEHGDIHHTKRKKFLRLKLFILSWFCPTKFVSVSEFSARVLRELGVPQGKLSVVHNPALVAESLDPLSRTETRRLIGVGDEQHFVWLHTAMLRAVKNQKLLLEAFAAAVNKNPAQTLCLAGEGPERAALEQFAQELGLKDRVKFLGFQRDTSRWYQASDGFVLSSLSESLPMALLEAAAAGLPLVGTDVGGVNEIIHQNQNGLLVQSGKAVALFGALDRLASDRALARQMGQRSKELVEAEFSLARSVSSYLQLFAL